MIYREAARKLAALGCREVPRRGGGSHRKWQNPVPPPGGGEGGCVPVWWAILVRRTVTVPVVPLGFDYR
jgi:hypothetical protein